MSVAVDSPSNLEAEEEGLDSEGGGGEGEREGRKEGEGGGSGRRGGEERERIK